MHISSLGTVPEKHSIDKWHLILDLLHLKGGSINDEIDCTPSSLLYMKVDDVVQQVLILHVGNRCLIAKLDIESAFRNVPMHPHD